VVPPRVILDTCVLVAGLRSATGASRAVLERVGSPGFQLLLSVPLVVEYEAVLARGIPGRPDLDATSIRTFVGYLCSVATHRDTWFRWRPALRDPDDDFLLELAIAGSADAIITHNVRDFAPAAAFGVTVMTPGRLLRLLEERP
jgi:putative PIN family toxin of toxin-antitoxin system